MRSTGAALLVAAFLGLLAGCGGTSAPAGSAQGDRQWVANAGGVIDELERDVLLAGNGGGTYAAAAAALRNESNLYTVLVAYSDFGGCDHMLSAAGTPTARYAKVERAIAASCVLLQRAAALFTQAASTHDAHALLAATRTTLEASPLLVRAKAELDRAKR